MMSANVAGASLPGFRNARDTVIGDRPAAWAMVRTLWGASAERLRFFFAAKNGDSNDGTGGARMRVIQATTSTGEPSMNTIQAIETIRYQPQPNILWVRVHTDDGRVGLGETFTCPGRRRGHSSRHDRRFRAGSAHIQHRAHGTRSSAGPISTVTPARKCVRCPRSDIALWDLKGHRRPGSRSTICWRGNAGPTCPSTTPARTAAVLATRKDL